jgi:hypothetical protein
MFSALSLIVTINICMYAMLLFCCLNILFKYSGINSRELENVYRFACVFDVNLLI